MAEAGMGEGENRVIRGINRHVRDLEFLWAREVVGSQVRLVGWTWTNFVTFMVTQMPKTAGKNGKRNAPKSSNNESETCSKAPPWKQGALVLWIQYRLWACQVVGHAEKACSQAKGLEGQ